MERQIMNVPNELKLLKNWVGYNIIDGRKIPINPLTQSPASSTDPSTWTSFQEAKNKCGGKVGFVLQPPFVGIDMDSCIIDGKINAFALGIIETCNSYTERSVSGTGIHIIVKGELPQGIRTENIELYQTGRYFIVTGDVVYPYKPIRSVTKEELAKILPQQRNVSELVQKGESWVIPALEAISDGHAETGRTPTFVKVINSLKRRGLLQDEIESFLAPWRDKHDYGSDRLHKLIADQFKRYPPKVQLQESEDFGNLLEFMKDEVPVDYIVPGLIAENSLNIVAGLQESRKSWLLVDLALALASGTPWLQKFPCRQRRVLLIDQERPKTEMQRRIRLLAKGKDLNLAALNENFIPVAGTTIRLNLDASYDAFQRKLDKYKPEVLLIDSLKTFQSGEIKEGGYAQFFMERLKELRAKFGLTIVLLHHETKGAFARAREGLEVTAETIQGEGAIIQVPEGLFVVTNMGDSSMLYHVKNSLGQKIAPCPFKVTDIQDGVRLEAF